MLVVEYSYRGWTHQGELKEGNATIVLNRSEPSTDEELENLENDISDKVFSSGVYEHLQTNVLNFKE